MQKTSVEIGGNIYNVVVAEKHKERKKGLQGIDSVPENTGMLFIHDKPGIHCYWMKNTYVPLTMVFFDKHGTAIKVSHRSDTNSRDLTCPPKPTISVLEVPLDESLDSVVGETMELTKND